MSFIKRATCKSNVVVFTAMFRCECGHTESGASKSKKCPKCGKSMQNISASAGESEKRKE